MIDTSRFNLMMAVRLYDDCGFGPFDWIEDREIPLVQDMSASDVCAILKVTTLEQAGRMLMKLRTDLPASDDETTVRITGFYLLHPGEEDLDLVAEAELHKASEYIADLEEDRRAWELYALELKAA